MIYNTSVKESTFLFIKTHRRLEKKRGAATLIYEQQNILKTTSEFQKEDTHAKDGGCLQLWGILELKGLPNVRFPGVWVNTLLDVFSQNTLKLIEFPFSHQWDRTVLMQRAITEHEKTGLEKKNRHSLVVKDLITFVWGVFGGGWEGQWRNG